MIQIKTKANKNKRNFTLKVYENGKIKETIQTMFYDEITFNDMNMWTNITWTNWYKAGEIKEPEERQYYKIPNMTKTPKVKVTITGDITEESSFENMLNEKETIEEIIENEKIGIKGEKNPKKIKNENIQS